MPLFDLRTQKALPLNPGGIAGMAADLVVTTAVSFVTNTDLQARSGAAQIFARGPACGADRDQAAWKHNGGGFTGVNSAPPFENPTIAANRAQSLSILLIRVAVCLHFDRMVGTAGRARRSLSRRR